jgi:hypothetical protein
MTTHHTHRLSEALTIGEVLGQSPGVKTFSHPARLVAGELLVRKGTVSDGPLAARAAVARFNGDLLTIRDVERDGLDVAYELEGHEYVKSTDELAADFERLDGSPV